MLLQQGQLEHAMTHFDTALTSNPKMIPAMLGKANVLFNQKKYKEALEYYKKVLLLNPNCPADVRLGIGLCYYKLENLEKAQLAFQRVLQLV